MTRPTLTEAAEIVEEYETHRSEMMAEIGSGAVSLGFDPYDAMSVYGWDNPVPAYAAEAYAVLAAAPKPVAAVVAPVDADDLPF